MKGLCSRGQAAKSCVQRKPAWQSHRCRQPLRVSAIGFDFGNRDEPELRTRKKISSLGALASTLLVLQPVLKGSVAEAFLASLAATQRAASNKDVIAAFSKFWGLLLSAGYDSWQEYLLDQLLSGRDNQLARACAQGTVDEDAPIMAALAHDLEVLQSLAISLPELVEYVSESAPMVGSEWVHAAGTPGFQRSTRRLGSGAPLKVTGLNLDTPSRFIQRPPTQDELAQWKALVTNKESWAQAAPALRQYWSLHGFGITSRNSALRWTKGALEELYDSTPGAVALPNPPQEPLQALASQASALAHNTERHCEGLPAHHALVAGPSGSGKSWLLWDSTLRAGRERGLRLVEVPGSDPGTILEAARGCGRYPRVRFVLVADHVDLPLRGSAAGDLLGGLSGVGPSGWPSNTLLYLGVSASSAVNLDPFVSRFGLKVFTKELDEGSFKSTLKELAARHAARLGQSGEAATLPQELLEEGTSWAKQATGTLSIRAASMYIARCAADNRPE